jgi:hypothetical protein
MLKTWTMLIAAGVVLPFAAFACGGGGDEKTIDTGDGEVTIGTDLPDDFPDSFPIYDGADLQSAIRGEQDGIEGVYAIWTTGDDFDDVKSFYEDAFDGDTWTTVSTGTAGGATYWAVEETDGDGVAYVSVTDGDDVAISASVGEDGGAEASDDDGGPDDASDEASDDDGSSDDEASSDDEGSESDGSEDDGSAVLPDEIDLPDGFPSDIVSLPDGARVTTAQSYSANGQETFIVGFHTKDSAKDVGEYFKGELEGSGYTQSLQTSDGNGVYAAYAENADGTGTIVVISVNDSSAVEGYREGVVQLTRS